VNEELARRYEEALRETLGWEGRMISLSKSGYSKERPDHVPVFNGNVCLVGGKVWWGDLDLTLDEPKLVDLARRVGQTVYVLYEGDGRFDHAERPLLADAVYSVCQCGHCDFEYRSIERARDGALRRRPPPPETRRRFVLTFGRPRLWRFWRLDQRRSPLRRPGEGTATLLYIGERWADGEGRRHSPMLVLGLFRDLVTPATWLGVEWTWYPTSKRSAPRPLLNIYLQRRHRRLRPYLALYVHPGFSYYLRAGIEFDQRWGR
jgi:hypothetical protein